ncbi:major facilitator superfamily protein [Artemisia annua]|uniref:Major facilitator superfamily protein n=1 Tax=Artemisia annua TaxID=35608 RepID=A0A2U1L5D4_ARTAN|nr:major facilitator superfamily protein [Artemisia annua]
MEKGFLSPKGRGRGKGIKDKQSSLVVDPVEANDYVNEAFDAPITVMNNLELNADSCPLLNTLGNLSGQSFLKGVSSGENANFRKLLVPAGNGADVVVSMESVRIVQERFGNSVYGFFLGKLVACLDREMENSSHKSLKHMSRKTKVRFVSLTLKCGDYQETVVNEPLESISHDLGFNVNSLAEGLVVSTCLGGAFIGSLFSGWIADEFGCRRTFQLCASPLIIGTACSEAVAAICDAKLKSSDSCSSGLLKTFFPGKSVDDVDADRNLKALKKRSAFNLLLELFFDGVKDMFPMIREQIVLDEFDRFSLPEAFGF